MRMHRKGGKKRTAFPKGRVVDEQALEDVSSLIGARLRPRHELIECLHLLQDEFGCLHAHHMRALAELMRLSQAEVYEVASFYHHFDIVKEGEVPPPPITIRICNSVSCQLKQADKLIQETRDRIDPQKIRIIPSPCMGACDKAPAAMIDRMPVEYASKEMLLDGAGKKDAALELPDYKDLDVYLAEDGYSLLKQVRAGQWSPDRVIELLSQSGLRGLGGAGFPAGKKWGFVRSYPGPRLMTINGDEGEPGTFKDRFYLSRDPHRMIEGALIAAHIVQAEQIYFYLRDEYPELHALFKIEIGNLEQYGLIAPDTFILRRGAGAYICGEESAMIESIEGKRGLPRHRPPFIAEVGLFGRPTLNHNVETLYWVRDILQNGPDWFVQQGKSGDGSEHPGLRSYSVSGRVKKPGVVLAPAGTSLSELINDYCDGMEDGHRLKAFLPGGASGGIFPASFADKPLDFGTFEPDGGFVGSHAVVVLSDQDSVRDIARNLIDFFAHESCGQCTPCRSGTEKLSNILSKHSPDQGQIEDLCSVMRDASICGLGQAAPNPIAHLLRFFKEELT